VDRRRQPPALWIVDADAELAGLSRFVLAEVTLRRVAEAVVAYRHDREPGYLWRHVAYALAAPSGFSRSFR